MPVIRNLTNHTLLADQAALAQGMLARMRGLLHRASLGKGEALILPRCNSIHTWFMRFPIDVVFVRTAASVSRGTVIKVVPALPPFRLAWARRADTVVELPIGTIARTKTKVGELLDIRPPDPVNLRYH
jgi:uncharacterized membrane protein (UPF0127 family)